MDNLLSVISDQLVGPILVVILASALAIGKSYLNKITDSILTKNDLNKVKDTLDAKSSVLKQIETTVENAVAANMQDADALKASGNGKLSDDEKAKLKSNAKTLVMTTLPSELFDENSSVYSMFGGRGNIEAIVEAMIESYVFKLKDK